MNNPITQENLQNISLQTENLVNNINEGIQWVSKHLKDNDRSETNYKIKQYRRKLKKIQDVITQKPTIALFGASQVGKSYMANNLLYNENNKLEVYDHTTQNTIDFIKYINPEGKGNEATAPVTRFTSDQITDKSKLPVKIRLFTPKDIICILCDTYYNDFNDKKPMPNKDSIIESLQSIPKYKNNIAQKHLDDDDIYEIKEYLEKYFSKHAFILELQATGFWDVLAENISHIHNNNWADIFKILWNEHSEISKVFVIIMEYLTSFQFSKEVHVGFDAIERKGENSIISVQTLLKGFFDDHHKSFKVQLNDGKILEAPSAKLCFITSEVVLSVAEGTIKNRPFIKNVDIIDFPGARSRPEIHELSDKSILEMLLRGKVSYLFNLYSLNYKSNTLSVCMRTQQTNVTTVPRLVNQWIEDNLGSTPQERAINLANMPTHPLFVIFTWWNTQFLFKQATDDPDPKERIEKLFETRFNEEVKGSFDWNENWIENNNSKSRFTNYYLLRDFKESTEIFNTKDTDEGQQVEITENLENNGNLTLYDDQVNGNVNNFFENNAQKDFHKKYFEKFVEYHKNKKIFFENPELNFLESSIPGKDGSEYIIKNLIPISSNTVSVPIYINVLNKALKEAQKELVKHYHSDSADEQILKAAREGSDIQLTMSIVFGKDAYFFGKFIELLCVSENEILEFYHVLLQDRKMVDEQKINTYILIKAENPELNPEKTYEQNIEILRKKYNFNSKEETEKYFEEKEIDLKELFYGNSHNLQNNSMILSEAAKDFWIKNKLDVEKFHFFTEKGIDKAQFRKLFENLIIGFNTLQITHKIAAEIREFVDRIDRLDEAEDMISHITAGKINEFINSLGWSYYPESEKEKIKATNEANNLNLKIPNDQNLFSSLEKLHDPNDSSGKMSMEKLIDFMDNINKELNKSPIDIKTLNYTPMIKNYQNWIELMRILFLANCDIPTYDIEANRKLGEILEKLHLYKFSID